jgi:hypothetical protein
MLVMNLCRVVARFPFRVVVVVIISTIQALPGQLALMCSGDSFPVAPSWCRARGASRDLLQ